MMDNKLIYIVDDEVDICKIVKKELEGYGYRALCFHTGTTAMKAIQEKLPDICIVDLGLPDMDGLSLVKYLLNNSEAGIIILSGRSSLSDKVIGLELGADDFISKPFEPRELVARTNSIARRLDKKTVMLATDNLPKQAFFGQWVFNTATLTLSHTDGHQSVLSAAESDLLISLLKSPQQILSREQLMKDSIDSFDRCIDVKMSRVRKKVELNPKSPLLIKTVYGAGYMFTEKVDWK